MLEFAPVSLSGGDALMFALDDAERGYPNYCYCAVELGGELDFNGVQASIESNAFVQFLSSLTLTARDKGYWESGVPEQMLSVECVLVGSLDLDTFRPEEFFDGREILTIKVLRSPEKHYLVMAWHHAILDAHGAELLIKYLSKSEDSSRVRLIPKSHTVERQGELNASMLQYLATVRDHDAFLLDDVGKNAERRFHNFTAQETEAVWQNCSAMGCEYARGTFLMAASALAIRLSFNAASDGKSLIAALPMDTRRKGVDGPIFPNHLSLLLFKLEASLAPTLCEQSGELRKQLQGCIENGAHKSMREFLATLNTLSSAAGKRLLRFPTGRSFASFVVSYTGEAKIPDSFQNCELSAFYHYPPLIVPPGLSFVFSEFQKRLRLCVVSGDAVSQLELDQLVSSLRGSLLNAC